MSKVAMKVVAGFGGAVRGLVFMAFVCIAIALLPPAVVSYLNRGTVGLDAFLPHTVTASASTSSQVRIDGSPAEQAAVRKALDQLVWPVDPKAFSVRIVPHEDLPNDPGMYVSPESVILIDAAIVDDPIRQDLARVLAHEVGHAVDVTQMDDQARAEFMSMRGFAPTADWRDSQAVWSARPQEDFAEVFAAIDSPNSVWPIQTVGGRMINEGALRALIERYQPGPSRPRISLDFSAVGTQAANVVGIVLGDTFLIQLLAGIAILYASVSAIQSMNNAHW